MELLDTGDASERLEDLVHFDTQRAPTGIDLTVGAVEEFSGAGQLDFGGSEFEPAAGERLEPVKKDEGDEYGWWSLEPGHYRAIYNERFVPEGGEFGIVRPLPRLLRAGATHAPFEVHEERPTLEAIIAVGSGGVELKENFRASRLQVFRRA